MNRELMVHNGHHMPNDRPHEAGGQGVFSSAPPIVLQLWSIARRWKWILLAITSVVLIAGLVLTLLATPQYTAVAQLEISRERQNISPVEGLESERAGQDREFFQTQYALLEARSLAERVARQLRLSNDELFVEVYGLAQQEAGGLEEGRDAKQIREERARLIVNILLGSVSIEPVRNSALVAVAYTSPSPELSAKIANAWVEQFKAASVDRRFSSTADARSFLEGRLQELRTRLEESERGAANYAAAKGIVTLGETRDASGNTTAARTLTSSQLEEMSQSLSEARAQRVDSASRAGIGGSSIESLNNPTLSRLRENRAVLAADLSRLGTQFEDGYPEVVALTNQIRVIDQSIAREEARIREARRSDYKSARAKELELERQVNGLRDRLSTQERDSIQYNILKRRADADRQLYEALLQRYNEIGVSAVEASNIAIIDRAEVPMGPSSPSLPLNIVISLFLGLGLAGAAAIILDQMDEGLREPDKVSELLGIPLLGSVPDTEDKNAYEQIEDIKSELSEAYLSIRSNLAFATSSGVPGSMMVTSSRPAEGKTTTSYALATVLGRSGKNVILIDADMRSPSLAEILSVPNSEGLSNFLAGDDDWTRMVQLPSEAPFAFLPSGLQPPSASELLSSDRMSRLIAVLSENYDHVVVDAPPLLGLADAPLISRTVDGSVMVIETGGVAVRGLRSAISRLQSVKATIYGAVVTKLDAPQAGYGYGYDYGYGYGDREATE